MTTRKKPQANPAPAKRDRDIAAILLGRNLDAAMPVEPPRTMTHDNTVATLRDLLAHRGAEAFTYALAEAMDQHADTCADDYRDKEAARLREVATMIRAARAAL